MDALEVCKARVSDEGGGGFKVVLFFSLHSLVSSVVASTNGRVEQMQGKRVSPANGNAAES